MNAHKKTTTAKTASFIGESFALFQHTIDKTVEWGFDKLQGTANKPKPKQKTPTSFVDKAKLAGSGTISFIGSAGTAYYKKYEQLKQKKSE